MHRFQATPTALPSPKTLRAYALIAVPLCCVAGALNAVGFLAVALNTSHVTGNWTRVAAELGERHFGVAAQFLVLAGAFLVGAMASTFFVENDLRQSRRIRYVKPLIVELVTLLWIAVLARHYGPERVPLLLGSLLAFAMGLQNATITKVSGAAVRTTHMTGITTDLGIELMRVVLLVREYLRRRLGGSTATETTLHDLKSILTAELAKAAFLSCMLLSFVFGGVIGALSFAWIGVLGVLPAAGVLGLLVGIQVVLHLEDRRSGHVPPVSTGRYTRTPEPAAPQVGTTFDVVMGDQVAGSPPPPAPAPSSTPAP